MRLPMNPRLVHDTLTWRLLILRWNRKLGNRPSSTKG